MAIQSWKTTSPSYMPDGFGLRNIIRGSEGGGFPDDPQQVTYVYTRGWSRSDFRDQISVHVSMSPGGTLAGTARRPGTPVDVGIAGSRAVYHDGQWHLDPAIASSRGLDEAFYWDTSLRHSITIHDGQQTYGIRAGIQIAVTELVKIARSLKSMR